MICLSLFQQSAVTSVRAVNSLTTTHHAAWPPALLLASAHASVSPRVPVLTAGARHVSLPHGTCGQGTCLPWTGCGCSTDVEGPLLLRARPPLLPGTAAAARLPGVQQSVKEAGSRSSHRQHQANSFSCSRSSLARAAEGSQPCPAGEDQ